MAKLSVSESMYKTAKTLQGVFDVTVVSSKGLIFMFRKDWNRLQEEIGKYEDLVWHLEDGDVPELFKKLNPHYIDLVLYDKSEEHSCFAIDHYDVFKYYCDCLDLHFVLLPEVYDINLIHFIQDCDANETNGKLGWSRTWHFIEVEDA